VMSSHDYYPLNSSAPNRVDRYIMIHPKSEQTFLQKLHVEFLLHFWKQPKDSVMMLASTQGT
jgi:hypothetical protein